MSGTTKGIFAEGVTSERSLQVEQENLGLWVETEKCVPPVTARVFEKDSGTISRACHTVVVGSWGGKARGMGLIRTILTDRTEE